MAMSLSFREVTGETWGDFERLFESRGGPKHCWCTAWRPIDTEVKTGPSIERKRTMEGFVRSGVRIGILGYRDGEPVAWCSIAPRATFRRLGGPEDADEGIWSLTCMFVKNELRGAGAMRELISAACDHAAKSGATCLEAYPVDPDSPSYRFMGFVPVFEKLGFEEVGLAGTRRHVMRRSLSG